MPLRCAHAPLAVAGCADASTTCTAAAGRRSTQPTAERPAPGRRRRAANNGAIFQAVAYRPLFEDHRARLAGDTLTVQIVEKVSASQKSTELGRQDRPAQRRDHRAARASAPTPSAAPAAAGTSSNTFAGKGATESSNDFSGTITVARHRRAAERPPAVAGEKQIGVNANVDVLRFSGQVDPRAIQPGNSVPSTQIANVRIEHRSRGQQADAQVMGWLARFFLSVLPI